MEIEIIEPGFEDLVAILRDDIDAIEKTINEEIEKATKSILDKYEPKLEKCKKQLERFVNIQIQDQPQAEEKTPICEY